MRKFFLAALAVAAVAATGMVPDAARARDYPFCIKGSDYGTPTGDCSFDTYQQCQATASGREAYCDTNPFYADSEKPIARPGKPRQHR
jgi:Protein of unknown function (DUF3551)